jgi:3-isopropylmalate/(R)-2-methylmalate dehydratase large subunit
MMGMTIAEKILSKKSLDNREVTAGNYVDARIDGLMLHTATSKVNQKAIVAGLPGGIPRIWDNERVYVLTDHHQPPQNELQARYNKLGRDLADRLGVKYFHDAIPGIAHQMMCDFGYVRPGELIVGPDSHCTLYGALNAAGTGIAEPDAAYAAVFGELWLRVPYSVKVTLTGSLPDSYPIAKDVILYLAAISRLKWERSLGSLKSMRKPWPMFRRALTGLSRRFPRIQTLVIVKKLRSTWRRSAFELPNLTPSTMWLR